MMMIKVRSLKDVLVVVVGCGVLGICAAAAPATAQDGIDLARLGSGWLGSARGRARIGEEAARLGGEREPSTHFGTVGQQWFHADAEPASQQQRAFDPRRRALRWPGHNNSKLQSSTRG
jgi:hypothetical protein